LQGKDVARAKNHILYIKEETKMAEFASNGKANAALATGIIGTSGVGLSLLNGMGGILGGLGGNNPAVNRYEAQQQARIAEMETEVKLRDANFYTLGEMGKFRDYVDARFEKVEHQLCDQRVYNATNTAAISCVQAQIAELMALTKRVVPNGSVCPGWGDVTVSVTPATTGA
jgi:hypothetical protein